MPDKIESNTQVNQTPSMSRRKFVTLAAGAGALTLAGQSLIKIPITQAKIQTGNAKGVTWAMVIDTTRCIGCRECVYACIRENNTSSTTQWIEVYEMALGEADPTFRHVFRGYPKVVEEPTSTTPNAETPWEFQSAENRRFLPVQCMNCDNPPCTQVCPVGATYKRADGIVAMDYDRCVGCRYCMTACPYAARVFNWGRPVIPEERKTPNELWQLTGAGPRVRKSDTPQRRVGVVEKCTFCMHRVQEGYSPACVVACPTRARHFGNINDPESEVAKLVKSGRCYKLGEELGTKPKVYYIM